MKVKELPIADFLKHKMGLVNIVNLTSIQQEALPIVLKGNNVIGDLISKCIDWARKEPNFYPSNFKQNFQGSFWSPLSCLGSQQGACNKSQGPVHLLWIRH